MQGERSKQSLWLCLVLVTSQACADNPAREPLRVIVDRPDFPLKNAVAGELERFKAGDELFEVTLREADGLGPLYIRSSCASCHHNDARGPGLVTKIGRRRADDEAHDLPATPLPHGDTVRPYTTAGARTPVTAIEDEQWRLSHRLPPAVFGRGYMEAVLDSEIERLEERARQRTNGIKGRIHRVAAASQRAAASESAAEERRLVGRFGVKARIAGLEEFTADALLGDMGITSPLRPFEPTNPEGITDDAKPGIDMDGEAVALLTDYVRLLEIPKRRELSERGRQLFAEVACSECHVPSLKTRSDYPIAELAGIETFVYTDFLLHRMGSDLADGVREGDARGDEFRTAPLIGLRFMTAYLHDGRAKSVEEAILAHRGPGSEANVSADRFSALSSSDRATLLRFVEAL